MSEVQVNYNFDLDNIHNPYFISIGKNNNISFKVEKPAKADEINQITKLYQDIRSGNIYYGNMYHRLVRFVNKYIKTYKMIPMMLEIDYIYNRSKMINEIFIGSSLTIKLEEGIRGDNPYKVSLYFSDVK